MPQSPVWLSSKQRYTQARRSSAWLHLPPPALLTSAPTEKGIRLIGMDGKDVTPTKTKSQFFTRPVLMPLGIGLSLLVLQQISGIDAIVFFTVEIFRASGTQQKQMRKFHFFIARKSK